MSTQLLTPGLHAGVPEAAYRADPGLNASIIKHGLGEGGSLAAMRWAMDNPKPATDAMDMGTLLHALVLEPDTFLDRVAIWDGDKRGKPFTEFEAANAGRIIIKPAQHTALARMRDSIMDHPQARALVTGKGMREATAIFNARAGLRGKARIDFLNTEQDMLVDLKTARTCDPRAWTRTAAVPLKYDVQQAWYQAAFYAVLKRECRMAFVVVENCDRHRCRVFTLPPEPIDACLVAIAPLLDQWAEALQSGVYPDLPINDPTEVEWPAWASRLAPAGAINDDDVPF